MTPTTSHATVHDPDPPERHSYRCDHQTSGECYCPAPGETATKPDCGHLVDAHCGCGEL